MTKAADAKIPTRADTTQGARTPIKWDTTNLRSSYANFCNDIPHVRHICSTSSDSGLGCDGGKLCCDIIACCLGSQVCAGLVGAISQVVDEAEVA